MHLSDKDWWRNAVIYQIYPRSFLDSNKDGIGDIKGIISKIDYLKSLEVDAIWLSPVFKSPMNDMGYDVSDYFDIDPLFGNMDDFEELINICHKNGLKLIIDQVYSHTSDEHPYFKQSKKDKENDKADWYVWADPKEDGGPPNNWLSVFGGSAWEWSSKRRQYYLHNFLKSQPDLNFHNIDVQNWVLSIADFWLKKGVDGFRLDVANYYFHDPKLRDNPSRKNIKIPFANPYGMQDHKYSINQKENFCFLKNLRKVSEKYKNSILLGEIDNKDLQIKYTEGGDKLHLAYSFELLRKELSINSIQNSIDYFYSSTKDGWPCWSFSNHDVKRHISRWSRDETNLDDLAKISCALLLSLKGTVCIYQGEELGQTETKLEFEELTDPPGIEFWPEEAGRDGCRTPMVWSSQKLNAGFSEVKPWLPVKKEQKQKSVDLQEDTNDSDLSFYKEMIKARKKHFGREIYDFDFISSNDLLIFSKGSSEKIFCIFNLDNETKVLQDKKYQKLQILPSNNLTKDEDGYVFNSYGFWVYIAIACSTGCLGLNALV